MCGTPYLKLLESIDLASSSSSERLLEAKGVFTYFGENNLKNFKDMASRDTVPARVSVYEIIRDCTYESILVELGKKHKQRLLTEGQIVEFCRKNSGLLPDGGLHHTLFPFLPFPDSQNTVALASVRKYPSGLLLDIYLGGITTWEANRRHRVVALKDSR